LLLLAALFGLLSLGCKKNDVPSAPAPVEGEPSVEGLLSRMTLEEKVGQMTQADRGAVSPESDIRDYALGSLLSGGGSAPTSNNAPGWADMVDRYQSWALKSRLKIPLLYGIDAVHGHNNVRGATIFPHNIGLGCTRDSALVARIAAATATEVAGTGIHWTFAPCIAVPRDERWGRTYEGFGETPALAVTMAAAAVGGFQTRILACAKHYVGDGGTLLGVNEGDMVADETTLRAIHLPGYRSAVEAGVGSVMASFNSWNGVKLHAHKYLLTTVLKDELGFQGFVVSDWGAVNKISPDYMTAVETAINAGVDMVMVPYDYKGFISTLTSLVRAGRVPVTRIDDAVRRILTQKFRLGLFAHPYADRSLMGRIGSPAHRALAREAVRKSVVVLKNEGGLLPLSVSLKRIHVAGRAANDLGIQCGGWTITWQGSPGPTTIGTTILDGIEYAVSPATFVTYDPEGVNARGADVGIVVVGESPYAESAGDRTSLTLSSVDAAAIAAMKNAGVPVVVIVISGRPMILGNQLAQSDALIAAWLPGTEGDGIADVLFGMANPTGRLSHSWPRTMGQIPLNVGDPVYDPLFPYGFGLSY
jgi:beta-glucosidase